MNKKGLYTLVIINAVLAFALVVYTVVCAFVAAPKNIEVHLVNGETYSFGEGKLSFSGDKEALVYNAETNTYTAVNTSTEVGFTRSVTVVKRSGIQKTTYKVTVHRNGSGTVNDPYTVNSMPTLKNLFDPSKAGCLSSHYNMVADIDMSSENWMPIGNVENAFTGTFNGNGHSLLGLTIHVTNVNKDNYIYTGQTGIKTGYKYLDLGFFGVTQGAKVSGLGIKNYSIKVDADVQVVLANLTAANVGEVVSWNIGSLTGTAIDSTIIGIENKSIVSGVMTELSFGYEVNSRAIYGATGGLIGSMRNSTLQNYSLDVDIISQKLGAYVGGLVGQTYVKGTGSVALGTYVANQLDYGQVDSSITNCDIKVDMEGNFSDTTISTSERTVFAGIATKIENTKVTNVNVEMTLVKSAGTTVNLEESNKISMLMTSGVGYAVAYKHADDTLGETILTNVQIKSANIKLSGAYVSGLAINLGSSNYNYKELAKVSMLNCGVEKAQLIGDFVAGAVYNNMGEITYTEDYKNKVAVNASIEAYNLGAGYVSNNLGTIKNTATEKVEVVAEVLWTGSNYAINHNDEYQAILNKISQELFISGFATRSYGANSEISGFAVTAVLKNGLNMSGLVGEFGFTRELTETGSIWLSSITAQGGKIENCSVNATIVSGINTNKVGGAVCEMAGGATLTSVNTTLTFNDTTSSDTKVYASVVGGMVARISGQATMSQCTVDKAVIKIDDGAYNNTTGDKNYKWNVVGGFVGLARSYDSIINYQVSGVAISNCAINNIAITNNIDLTEFDLNKDTNGIGGFAGSLKGIINISTITASNVVINYHNAIDQYVSKDCGSKQGSVNFDNTNFISGVTKNTI